MSNQLNKFGGGNEDQCDGQKDGKSPSRDRLKQLIGESKEVPFLVQLQTMLDQETYNNSDAIQWLETGDGFVITDQNKLVKEIIPKFFPKPIIFQSFVRKLYKFSFRQIDSSNKGRYEFVSNNNDFHRKTTKPFIHVDAKIDDATRSKTSNFLDNEENNYDASSHSNLVGLSEAQHTENGITDIFSNTSNLITRSLRSYGIPQNEWQPQLQSFLHLNSIKNTQLWRKLNDSIGTHGEPSEIEAEKIVLKILMHLQSQQPQQRRQIQEEEGMATLTESNATASVESSNVVESMQTNKSRNSGHVHQNNPTSSCMLRREIEQQFIRFESTMSHLLNRYNPNEQHITDLFLALRSANNIQDGDVHRNLQQQQQETVVSEENNIFENSFLRHQKGLMLLLHHHHQQQLDSKIGRLSKTASGKIGLPSLVSAPATDAVFGTGNSAVPFDLNESQQLQLLGTERNTGNSHIERVVNDHDNNNNSKVLQSNIPVHLLSNIYQNVLSSENQAEHHQNTRTRMLAQPPGGGGVEMLLSHQMQHLNDHAKNDQQHGRVWATGPSSLEEMLKLLHRLQGQSQTGSVISQSQDRPSHMTFFEIGQLLQTVSNQQGQRNYSSLPAESAFATATSLGPSEPITTFFADAARSPRKVSSEIILNNAKSFDSQRENDHRGCESGWEYILSELIRQKMAQNRELGAQDPSYNQQRSGSGSGSGLLNPGLSQQQQNQKNDWHENSRDNASSSVPMPGFSIIDYLTRDYVCSSSACQTDDAAESQDQDRKPSSEQERARDPRKILRQSELVRGLSGIGVDTNSNLGLLTMQRKGIELQDREEHVSASAAVEATTAVAAAASSTSLTRQQEEAARIDAYHSYLRMKLNENSDADSHWKDDQGVENGESGDEADEKSEWGSGKKSKKRKI